MANAQGLSLPNLRGASSSLALVVALLVRER